VAQVFGARDYQQFRATKCGSAARGTSSRTSASSNDSAGGQRSIYDSVEAYKGWLATADNAAAILDCNRQMKKLNGARWSRREAGHQRRTKALLLAGGLGTRLRPITDATPKCLVEIAGRPLLDYWFEALSGAGVRDVLINTHHLPEAVRRFLREKNRQGFRSVETFEPTLLGSAGTIAANPDWADDADEVLIIYADNLSNLDVARLLAAHRGHGDPMTMLLFRAPDQGVRYRRTSTARAGHGVRGKAGRAKVGLGQRWGLCRDCGGLA
jgi:CTP:molybdopterin cytidylyltransferase MocA